MSPAEIEPLSPPLPILTNGKSVRTPISNGGISNGTTTELSDLHIKDTPVENFRKMRVVIIGAGFSGIYCGVRIPERLRNVELAIYEKNDDVGGTWYENRYPGCACDIPSHSYQYTFAPNPAWSRVYARGSEIHQYLKSVVKRYSVDRFVKLSHQVLDVEWHEDVSKWFITVQNRVTGETFVDKTDVVISARGTLNDISWPGIPGLKDMKIPVMHSAAWDDKQKFEGKRIGIIGSGSSAIQIIPALQKVKDTQLTCLIRSKIWIANPFGAEILKELGIENTEFTPEQRARFAKDPEYYLKFRTTLERAANLEHSVTLKDSQMQNLAREAFTSLMTERLSKKPEILKHLLPDFGVGCRRLTPGPGFLEALVEDNVTVTNAPIKRAYENGLELQDGTMLDLDALVCATGFRTSAPPPFRVVGVNGQLMSNRFHPFPETYMSLATDGFPNYFMMLGPNAAIGTGPLTTMMEMTGDYIVKCIRKMQKENIVRMEVQRRRVRDFSAVAENYFKKTVYLDNCSSWYRNEGGKGPRISGLWPGSALHAMETIRSPRWEDYDYKYEGEDNEGKEVNRLAWLGNGWSIAQTGNGEAGELAHFLQPAFVDVPAKPLPEETFVYKQKPFSH
ncbi:monooxygenase, putative [Talaromyces stipitatus ATCC 10500]|uniref:L-ornithine N(5)-monooxygenase n=1 Tax=Talaromyces stipitatus (strain ATCC 10500 / CBS 375.48 / QM 6759 / NRRL 1006) TaxID=441959 RepID=B8M1T3_TALSN|nr:monooxygenase, putative [Talaromyces stipitatus ATCC 10500]EED21311.1 monooxygenase, putative [Talaromyces stipitatus ATCC 10500]